VSKVLVVAPHPDDETLGCGGTLLRHRDEGDEIIWLIVTKLTIETGFSDPVRAAREIEIDAVADHYGMSSVEKLGLVTTRLDDTPLGDIIPGIANVIAKHAPEIVYLPNPGDVHSDHKITFEACASCLKWTKAPNLKQVAVYETLSETDLSISDHNGTFRANRFVDISDYLEGKIEGMRLYKSEVEAFPFPRSNEAIRALATLRGAQSSFTAAEAFMVLNERY
jgi:N-acetylglucosamine malate deacetylase 1